MDDRRVEFKITEDKIIDILMHAATREDISKLDVVMRDGFAKCDARIEKLDNKISTLYILMTTSILIPILMHVFLK